MNIEVFEVGEGIVLRPDDELDLIGYQAFGEKVDNLLHEGAKRIVIDLQRATYVNSSTVRALVGLNEKARGVEAGIALAQLGEGALSALEASGALAVLRAYGTVEEAMSSLGDFEA